MGLFLVQALWLVFSVQYPMAFDENYHFGLIQLHAQSWIPFFTTQPPHSAVYGAVVRDPSYLYHYLMSFPYRLLNLFSHNQTFLIISLRLINVGLFGFSLVLYRKLLRRIGMSAAFTNSALLVYILIPVVPFLAAHINYDNLFLIAIPLAILLTLDVIDGLHAGRVSLARLLSLLVVMLLGSLVKYPFLPVMLVIVAYLVWLFWREKQLSRPAFRVLIGDFQKLSKLIRLLLVVAVLVSAGLFIERYGVNIVRYHKPVPACDNVIDASECLKYGPWNRDDGLAHEKAAAFHPNIITYTGSWFYGMWYRLFFAINDTYVTEPPLYIISHLAIVMAVLLVLGVIIRARRIFPGHPERTLLLLIILGYGLILLLDNYAAYVRTAQPVAINGRYWIPFLPLIFALGGIAWSQLLRAKQAYKAWVAAFVIVVFLLQGGGTMTYIIRSHNSWAWNNRMARSINGSVRGAVRPFIFGY